MGLAIVLLLGVLVFSPAVQAPLFLDDYLHVAMVEGTFAAKRGMFDLYDFVDAGDRSALVSRGLLPWWSHPELTIRFFRPLSSALLWSEHRVFSHEALPMHLHSFGWWLAAVLGARGLFRRFFAERPALLATTIFALSPCHALPLAWLANFEALVALAFGARALSWQLRFRASTRAREGACAGVFFALALAGGGEYALAFGGYVVALEIALRKERRSLGDRLRGVLPFVLPATSYLFVRSLLHYGAVGSGFYTDPLHDPIRLAKVAPFRLVALLADSWMTLGSDTWYRRGERIVLAALVIVIAIALVRPIRRAIAPLAPESQLVARTLVWGSLFALAPTLAVVPAFRLLGVSMIGVAATSALVLDFAWFSADGEAPRGSRPERRRTPLVTLAAIFLAFTQLVHGPMTAFLASRTYRRDGSVFALRAAWTRALVGGDATRAHLTVVRGLAGSFFLPFALDPRGRTPEKWRILSHAGHVLALRPDSKTIELVVGENRSVYPIGEPNLYRDPSSPLKVGDVVRTTDMTVTILEVGEIGPRRVRFVFDEELSASTWIVENFAAPTVVDLPDVGQGVPLDP